MNGIIKGGAKIRNFRKKDVRGTLACLVRDRDDPSQLYILSAAHVIGLNGYAVPGDAIEAESPAGSDQWTKIGEFARCHRWYDAPGAFQTCDAALARLTAPGIVVQEIEGIGQIGSVQPLVHKGMALQLRGAGTGQVCRAEVYAAGTGAVAIYADIESGALFELTYANQILYIAPGSGLPKSPTKGADSGALVLTADNQPIGMHFARTPDRYVVDAAICSPIGVILSALNVELVPPGVVGTGGAGGIGSAANSASAVSVAAQPVQAGTPTLPDDAGERGFDAFGVIMRPLLEPHSLFESVQWYLGPDGLVVDAMVERTPGRLVTVPRVWGQYGDLILAAAKEWSVPVELIVATICTESSGISDALAIETRWRSDDETPDRVSVGLMQTMIRSAREALGDMGINRAALRDPGTSIRAGTAYIARAKLSTRFDPPLVACAYNAGGLYYNDGQANRWKMKQSPIGSGDHADRFVRWFNDCFSFLLQHPGMLPKEPVSFVQLLRG